MLALLLWLVLWLFFSAFLWLVLFLGLLLLSLFSFLDSLESSLLGGFWVLVLGVALEAQQVDVLGVHLGGVLVVVGLFFRLSLLAVLFVLLAVLGLDQLQLLFLEILLKLLVIDLLLFLLGLALGDALFLQVLFEGDLFLLLSGGHFFSWLLLFLLLLLIRNGHFSPERHSRQVLMKLLIPRPSHPTIENSGGWSKKRGRVR